MRRISFILEASSISLCYGGVSLAMDTLLKSEPLRNAWTSALLGAPLFGVAMTAVFRWLNKRRSATSDHSFSTATTKIS